jgi:hypothetical protein
MTAFDGVLWGMDVLMNHFESMNKANAALTVSQVRDFLKTNIRFGSVFNRSLNNRLGCQIRCGKL